MKNLDLSFLKYAISDSKEKGKSGVCTLTSKKKRPFLSEKKFFEHYGFKVVDEIGEYQLLALSFDNNLTPKFNDNARNMEIDNQDFTIYYSNECPYVEYEVKELLDYAQGDGTSYVNLEYESPYIGDEITVDMMWTDVQTTQNMGSNLAGYFGVSEGYFTLMGTKKIQAPAEPNKRVKVKLVYAQNGQSSTSGGSTSGPTTITGGSTSLLVSLYIDDQYVTSAEGTSF